MHKIFHREQGVPPAVLKTAAVRLSRVPASAAPSLLRNGQARPSNPCHDSGRPCAEFACYALKLAVGGRLRPSPAHT